MLNIRTLLFYRYGFKNIELFISFIGLALQHSDNIFYQTSESTQANVIIGTQGKELPSRFTVLLIYSGVAHFTLLGRLLTGFCYRERTLDLVKRRSEITYQSFGLGDCFNQFLLFNSALSTTGINNAISCLFRFLSSSKTNVKLILVELFS